MFNIEYLYNYPRYPNSDFDYITHIDSRIYLYHNICTQLIHFYIVLYYSNIFYYSIYKGLYKGKILNFEVIILHIY